MAGIVIREATLSPYIPGIARLRGSVKVLRGRDQLRERISSVHLYVVGEPLVQIEDQTVVRGRPRILLRSDRRETWIWSGAEVSKSRVRRIGNDGGEVSIPFTKLSKTE